MSSSSPDAATASPPAAAAAAAEPSKSHAATISTDPSSRQLPAPRLGGCWVGCAGYSYPHWRKGVFYPRGLQQANELRYYSQVFDTCEVNTTFYGTPSEATVRTWQQQVAGNKRFLFTLKMRRSVTHGGDDGSSIAAAAGSPKRAGNPHHPPLHEGTMAHELPYFVERCEQLRRGGGGGAGDAKETGSGSASASASAASPFPPSLGVVLLQFPPSFEQSIEALERLARHLPKSEREGEAEEEAAGASSSSSSGGGRAYRYAFEFRHPSWYAPETYKFLRRQGWALVQHAFIHNVLPERNIPEVDEVTAEFVYLRLHGKKAEHAWDYSDEELRPYADKIVAYRRRGLDCYVYFLNDTDGHAPKNAFTLLGMVRDRCGEKPPTRPEDSQRISNYFIKAGSSVSSSSASASPAATTAERGGGEASPSPHKRPRLEETEKEKEKEEVKTPAAAAAAAATASTPSSSSSSGGGGGGEWGGGGVGSGAAAAAEQRKKKASKPAGPSSGTKPLTAFFMKKEG